MCALINTSQLDASVAEGQIGLSVTSRPWSSRQVLWAALVLSGLAALALLIDLPLAQHLSIAGLPGDFRRLVRLAEVFGWGGSVALIILTAGIVDSRGWRLTPRLAASALVPGLIADGMKLLVARHRPSAADLAGQVQNTFVGWLPLVNHVSSEMDYGYRLQSFPSGHAATATGLAVSLAMLYPRGRWLFVGFAILACVQRLDAQAHFASDVLAGAALACLVSAGFQAQRSEVRGQKTAITQADF